MVQFSLIYLCIKRKSTAILKFLKNKTKVCEDIIKWSYIQNGPLKHILIAYKTLTSSGIYNYIEMQKTAF